MISIDRKRCPGALLCGRCLEACGEGVLMAVPEGPVTGPSGAYRVAVPLVHRCTRCGRCVAVCPHGAVRLTL